MPHDPGALRPTASDTSVLSTRIKPLGFSGWQAPYDLPARRGTSDNNPSSVDSFPVRPSLPSSPSRCLPFEKGGVPSRVRCG